MEIRNAQIEVDGILRPSVNSSGRPIAVTYSALTAFWRYFGDSEVVDSSGRPLVVYHGSPNCSIDSFDCAYEGMNTGIADEQHGLGGFYFSNDPDIADTYARTIDVEMAVIAEREFDIQPRANLPQSTTYPVYLSIKKPFRINSIVTQDVLIKAKAGGHDGVIAYFGSQTEYLAFQPEQVKSSIGNPGSYCSLSPSLTDGHSLAIESSIDLGGFHGRDVDPSKTYSVRCLRPR